MPKYFPLLKDPSSSGFYSVGDMDVVSQSQIYGNISMLLSLRVFFPAVLRKINSVNRNLNTTHTKLIPGVSSVCSVGNLVMGSDKFALLERLTTWSEKSIQPFSLNRVCGLNVIVLFQRQCDLPLLTLTPEGSFSRWNINVHVLHTSNIAPTPCRVPGWFSDFLAYPPEGVVRIPIDPTLPQSAVASRKEISMHV